MCAGAEKNEHIYDQPADVVDVPTAQTQINNHLNGSAVAAASAASASPSVRPKRAPPLPPKRTNSVKTDFQTSFDCPDASSPASGNRFFPDGSPAHTESHRSVSDFRPTNVDNNGLPGKRNVNPEPCVNGVMADGRNDSLDEVINRLEMRGDDVTRPTKHKAIRHVSPGVGDGNTLPFANENIGTIKQKSSRPATASKPSIAPTSPNGNMLNGFIPKVDAKKAKPLVPKKSPKTLAAMQKDNKTSPNHSRGSVGSAGETGSLNGDDVFNDIDDMFQGLTQELDEMLTLQG